MQTVPDPAGAPRRFPLGSAVRLADLDVDPYPVLARLREHEPVTWVPETGMWFVTTRAGIVATLRDATRFTTDAERSTIRDIFGRHMMTTDGDEALRFRRACLHAFRADALLREMAPWVGERAGELVARPRGDEAVGGTSGAGLELMAGVATPLAVESALRVLGLPPGMADRIAGWYGDFAAALANFTGDADVRARGKAAAAAFHAAVRPRLTGASREEGGLLAHLAGAPAADRLNDDEILANALIILFGGIETTASMIGNTVWSLLATGSWPDFAAGRWTTADVIEEALRWQPAVQSITRHTTEEVEVAGVRIPSGSVVQSMIGGANRDPGHFDDPERFDPARANAADHLSFGTGRHLCLGAHLARIEIGAVLDALRARELRGGGPGTTAFASSVAPPLRGYEFRRPTRLTLT